MKTILFFIACAAFSPLQQLFAGLPPTQNLLSAEDVSQPSSQTPNKAPIPGEAPSTSPMPTVFLLDDVMTQEDQQKTGVANLTSEQKQALIIWLNQNFVPKPQVEAPPSGKVPTLYLSENIEGGKKLRLTDGSVYEVSPDDLNLTGFWITPFPIKILPSRDPQYPYLIINMNTGTAVKAKQLTPPTLPVTP